jgi:DNA polymerase III epsilon subunit-like protein
MEIVNHNLDRRKNYYMVLDTETCNGFVDGNGNINLQDSLVYDCGFAIVDKKGEVYCIGSYVISDIFYGLKQAMDTAYYCEKIPMYLEDISNGDREVVSLYELRKIIHTVCEFYKVTAVVAHNAPFDVRALNNTQRYVTKSKYRYFLPYGIPLWDTLKMATDTIAKQKMYIHFCETNGYMTKHKKPRVRTTAEILYRYISGNNDFIESHTGLEDVLIEKDILSKCLSQHKKMRKLAFTPKKK